MNPSNAVSQNWWSVAHAIEVHILGWILPVALNPHSCNKSTGSNEDEKYKNYPRARVTSTFLGTIVAMCPAPNGSTLHLLTTYSKQNLLQATL